MKALFLGGVAAGTAAGIRGRLPARLEVEILDEPIDRVRLPQAAADAETLVSNHWRADYPPAPNVQLVQSVATGIELIELTALPAGVAVCNAVGHESAIAEYVVMVMLAWWHRLFEISAEFREHASWRTSWVQGGAPHGEVRDSTLGIVGLAGSGAKWRGGRPRSDVVSSPLIARNVNRSQGSNGSSHSPRSTACYPNATLWRCVPRSAPRRPG